MARRTQGLGTTLGAGGLVGFGQDQQQQAVQLLGRAAEQENDRNLANEQLERQRKAGNQQLGATVGTLGGFAAGASYGASYGASAGPWGAVLGGIIGAIAGGAL